MLGYCLSEVDPHRGLGLNSITAGVHWRSAARVATCQGGQFPWQGEDDLFADTILFCDRRGPQGPQSGDDGVDQDLGGGGPGGHTHPW